MDSYASLQPWNRNHNMEKKEKLHYSYGSRTGNWQTIKVWCRVSDPDSGLEPYSIGPVDPDPDPGGQKWPTKIEKNW